MPVQSQQTGKPSINARTFQYKLEELATTIALKVQREGPQHGLKPDFLAADIYYLLRQSQQTYNTFFFMNADETRKDVDYRPAYQRSDPSSRANYDRLPL